MEIGLQILLEKLGRRSALPKFRLLTMAKGEMAEIVNTIALRYREISSEC
jgi:hypothetical protein